MFAGARRNVSGTWGREETQTATASRMTSTRRTTWAAWGRLARRRTTSRWAARAACRAYLVWRARRWWCRRHRAWRARVHWRRPCRSSARARSPRWRCTSSRSSSTTSQRRRTATPSAPIRTTSTIRWASTSWRASASRRSRRARRRRIPPSASRSPGSGGAADAATLGRATLRRPRPAESSSCATRGELGCASEPAPLLLGPERAPVSPPSLPRVPPRVTTPLLFF